MEIWRFAQEVSTQHNRIAEFCGVDPRDEELKELLRSMAASGFLRVCFGGYQPGIRPPGGPTRPQLTSGRPAAPDGPGETPAQRPGPSGVPFPDETPARRPDRPLPAGLRVGDDGHPEVDDNTLDRVAKADLMPALSVLGMSARAIRDELDSGDMGDDNESDLLHRLLGQVDKMMNAVGYSDIGSAGECITYNPELHQYCGILPAGGVTEEVYVTSPGQAWTHRDKVIVVQKAYVNLLDDDMGEFVIQKAGDIVSEDDPEVNLWFDDQAAFKPDVYAGPGWYRCTRAYTGPEIYDQCEYGQCLHPKAGNGLCDAIMLFFDDGSDYLVVPSLHHITTAPSE